MSTRREELSKFDGSLDDAAWEEELAFIKQHTAASPQDGQKRQWRREDSYDKRRLRLPMDGTDQRP